MIEKRRHIALIICLCSSVHAADVTIHPLQHQTNEFSGREIKREFRVASDKPLVGRLVWRLSTQQRTLARGEQAIRVESQFDDVSVRLRVDSLRDEVVLPTTLTVAVLVGQDELAHEEFRLSFFAVDPYRTRDEWLKSLNITLFDPVGRTEKTFTDATLPFTATRNLTTIRRMKQGTLVIGTGISLRDHRGLGKAALTAAAQGTHVLWLAPTEVAYPIESLESADDLAFADAKIIQRIDKRFDALTWSKDKGVVAARLRLQSVGQRIVVEAGDEGWPWMEARWSKTNGHFIVCGFSIVDCWDDNPTPRYLLLRLFQRLEAEEELP
jgi:hypothetical protein